MSHKETRHHKVKTDFGITDYFKFYKKSADEPVDEKTFKAVLKDYLLANKNAISHFAYSFRLPQRLGRIEVRKVKKEVKISTDGKIINNLPINWKATKQLWESNEQAKKKKSLIRYTNEHTGGFIFRIVYLKYLANFKNKSIYKMLLNREMRRNTNNGIVSKRIDAFLLNPTR